MLQSAGVLYILTCKCAASSLWSASSLFRIWGLKESFPVILLSARRTPNIFHRLSRKMLHIFRDHCYRSSLAAARRETNANGQHLRSLAVTCSRRSLAVTCGHLLSAVTCGHLRALAVTCGHLLSAVTCGHLRLLALGGHLRSLAVTRVAASDCKWLIFRKSNTAQPACSMSSSELFGFSNKDKRCCRLL